MAKMGRPTTNLRNCSLHLRVSEKELQLISDCAEKYGLNRTDTIVKAVEMLLDKAEGIEAAEL